MAAMLKARVRLKAAKASWEIHLIVIEMTNPLGR
jgi:hypothetical protein